MEKKVLFKKIYFEHLWTDSKTNSNILSKIPIMNPIELVLYFSWFIQDLDKSVNVHHFVFGKFKAI